VSTSSVPFLRSIRQQSASPSLPDFPLDFPWPAGNKKKITVITCWWIMSKRITESPDEDKWKTTPTQSCNWHGRINDNIVIASERVYLHASNASNMWRCGTTSTTHEALLCTTGIVSFRACSVNPITSGLTWIERNFDLYRIYSSSIHSNPERFYVTEQALRMNRNIQNGKLWRNNIRILTGTNSSHVLMAWEEKESRLHS
jgi:hypothetical protein